MLPRLPCIITFGLPGSGKTTYLEKKYRSGFQDGPFPYIFISADEIKKRLTGYDPKNPELVHQKSVEIAETEVYEAVRDRKVFIFDSGSINNNYSKRIFQRVSETYDIYLLYFDTPLEICLERNKQREFVVPEENIIKKHGQLANALHQLMPFVDEIKVIHYDQCGSKK